MVTPAGSGGAFPDGIGFAGDIEPSPQPKVRRQMSTAKVVLSKVVDFLPVMKHLQCAFVISVGAGLVSFPDAPKIVLHLYP